MNDETAIQRYVRDLSLAESAMAEELWPAAVTGWERVTAANPVVGRSWSQLGAARMKTGDLTGAIDAFERALELRDGFPAEMALEIGRAHARLGDRVAAFHALERSVRLGLRSLAVVREDEDLALLRDDPAFRALVGIIDRDALSRDEGWISDLHFLWREIKRLAVSPFRLVPEPVFLERIVAIEQAIPRLSDLQIVVEIERLLALLGDGHAGIYQPPAIRENRLALPLQFYQFEEGVFIIAAGEAYRELLGAELIRIDGRSIEELTTALTPLICRDNDQWLKNSIPHRLRETPVLHALGLIPKPELAVLMVRTLDGAVQEVTVVGDTSYRRSLLQRHFFQPGEWVALHETLRSPSPRYLKNRAVGFWFEPLYDDRLVYAQINGIRDHAQQTLPDFGEQLIDIAEGPAFERLVIDLRWNPGGNTFLEMPLLHRIIGSKKLNRLGRLFVIIGRATFSAAQNFTTLLERHTNAIFVGEPTGSSPTFVGETIEFELPYSGCFANVSDLLWQSGWPTDYRPWVAPQLYTPPTFAAFRENRDPALEAILALGGHLPGL